MAPSRAFALLRAGVPLTLLIDMWSWDGPDSFDILRREARSQAARLDAT